MGIQIKNKNHNYRNSCKKLIQEAFPFFPKKGCFSSIKTFCLCFYKQVKGGYKVMTNSTSPIEVVVAIIIGLLIVLSVPILTSFFMNIIGQILAIILSAIFIGVVIWVVWLLFEHYT